MLPLDGETLYNMWPLWGYIVIRSHSIPVPDYVAPRGPHIVLNPCLVFLVREECLQGAGVALVRRSAGGAAGGARPPGAAAGGRPGGGGGRPPIQALRGALLILRGRVGGLI